MHPAHVVQMSRRHSRTVGGDILTEFRNWEFLTVLGDQPVDGRSSKAIAAVARILKDRESGADLAEGDEAGRHGGFLFTLWSLRRTDAINLRPNLSKHVLLDRQSLGGGGMMGKCPKHQEGMPIEASRAV